MFVHIHSVVILLSVLRMHLLAGINKKRRWKVLKRILIALIQFYRKYLSPLKTTKCPYYPTCSTYGLEAIEKHGVWKGSLLAIWRILRCNPFSKGGYDPVP